MPHGADPRLRPSPPDDSRWQRGEVVDALYLAEDEPTLWAEWYRHLAERGFSPSRRLPRDVWRYRVRDLQVADLSDADRLARVGLPLPQPGRRTWPAYQEIGESLWKDGWNGVVSPSAARPAGQVLCVFIQSPGTSPVRPFGRPRVVLEPPVVPSGMRT